MNKARISLSEKTFARNHVGFVLSVCLHNDGDDSGLRSHLMLVNQSMKTLLTLGTLGFKSNNSL